ncbi:hypothetical protein V8C44DRAFT_188749 [Trichoderma aethiopicum]
MAPPPRIGRRKRPFAWALAGCTCCTPYEYYLNSSSCNDLKAAILLTNKKKGSALRLIKSRNVDPTAPEKSYMNMNDQRRKKKRVDSRVPSSVVFNEWNSAGDVCQKLGRSWCQLRWRFVLRGGCVVNNASHFWVASVVALSSRADRPMHQQRRAVLRVIGALLCVVETYPRRGNKY